MADWLTEAAERFEGLDDAQISAVNADIPVAADIIAKIKHAMTLPLQEAAPIVSGLIPEITRVLPTLEMVLGKIETAQKEYGP